MNRTEILKHNEKQFLKDMRIASRCVILARATDSFLEVKKIDVKCLASRKKIHYYISDEIYASGCFVMVIL